ncbi:MAG: HD-GYP domain-containing protein [Firmicutes bacterium]|nr:HD-GYP domain-containing protein [Bacillota bacterium]MCL5040682.1 HD-GYP domain-containing protein [Bacillota bacterium]
MKPLSRNLKIYFLTVIGLTLGVSYFLWSLSPVSGSPSLVLFLVLTQLSELGALPLPQGKGTVSVGFSIIYAVVLLFGPTTGALMAAIGTLRVRDFSGKVPWLGVLFNRAQLFLAAGMAGWIFLFLGGKLGGDLSWKDLPALGLAALAYWVTNVGLITLAISIAEKMSLRGNWAINIRWLIPHMLALAPLGILIAVTYRAAGPFSVLLFFLPLLVARYSFQKHLEMRDAFQSTIRMLMAVLDARDNNTRGHSQRVAEYAVAIGKQLKLTEDQLELLNYAGLLHDIGKVGITDAVLKKAGIYSDEEYRHMRRHPAIGEDIIKDISLLGTAREWVLHHHERFDGRGFPGRLKGEVTPLGARIITLADAFDAIVSDRPYKRGLPLPQALEEIKSNSGSQFDPEVVAAFLPIAAELASRVMATPYPSILEKTRVTASEASGRGPAPPRAGPTR